MNSMSLEERIEHHERLVRRYRLEKARKEAADRVRVGDDISFRPPHGPGEELTGTVLGIKDVTTGRWIKVRVGDGFDAPTYSIRAKHLIIPEGRGDAPP